MGHSKKSGKGGGGAGGGRRSDPSQRKQLKRDPGIPDLKRETLNLARTAQRKTHSVMSIRQGGVQTTPATSSSSSSSLLGRKATGGLFSTNSKLSKYVSRSAGNLQKQQGDYNNNTSNGNEYYAEENMTEEELLAQRKREISSLALRTVEKSYNYEAPMQYYNGSNHLLNGEDAGEGYSTYHNNYDSYLSVEDVDKRDNDRSLRRFFKEFNKVVESCDVLLQVLDARDPLGCRLTQLENNIRSSYGEDKKQIVIVLNKVDLLPSKEVLDAWIYYFEQHEHVMCIPFSATSKAQQHFYVSNLFKQLRSLARSEETGERKSIVVGVIGYPNVGKSSIINALKRKNVVGVGNTPGFTTGNTEVELRSDIRVMDCPGVVSPGEDQGDVILRNAVNVHELVNPFLPVQRLLQRCAAIPEGEGKQPNVEEEDGSEVNGHVRDQRNLQYYARYNVHPLSIYYQVGTFDPNNVMEFIQLVGLRRGRLRKGGEVDEEGTARMILSDWNDGRIGYYTYPPAMDSFFASNQFKVNSTHGQEQEDAYATQLVDSAGKGITVDGLPTFHLFMGDIEKGSGSHKRQKWS